MTNSDQDLVNQEKKIDANFDDEMKEPRIVPIKFDKSGREKDGQDEPREIPVLHKVSLFDQIIDEGEEVANDFFEALTPKQ